MQGENRPPLTLEKPLRAPATCHADAGPGQVICPGMISAFKELLGFTDQWPVWKCPNEAVLQEVLNRLSQNRLVAVAQIPNTAHTRTRTTAITGHQHG